MTSQMRTAVLLAVLAGILLEIAQARAQEKEIEIETAPPGAIPITLDEARAQALAYNKQLELGRLNVSEKQIAISAATTDYLPKVLGSAAYLHFNKDLGTVLATRDRQIGGAAIGPGGILTIPTVTVPGRTISANVVNQDSAFGALIVAQPITKLIGVSALVDLARADAGIAEAQLDSGTRLVLSGVTQAYCGLLAARRIRTVLQLQGQAMAPLMKGKPNADLRKGALELRKGLVETEHQIEELQDLLNQLLGNPPDTLLELVEPTLPPVPVASAEEAASYAASNSPAVREASENIRKARAGLKAVKMEFLPDVNLIGAYAGQNAADYIQSSFSTVGVTASYTFVDWGKRTRQMRQRETQIAMASRNVTVSMEAVETEARKAYRTWQRAVQDLDLATETVPVCLEAEKEATILKDVVLAKAATAKAQLDQLQAEINLRIAHVKLLAAIGDP